MILCVRLFFFFFFKQKTAYELRIMMEFRRVLFRSGRLAAVFVDRRVAPPPVGAEIALARIHVGARVVDDGADFGIERARGERSEERRVGKECVSTCRSRWSPDH